MLIHTEKKPYGKSIHTGEEPYICKPHEKNLGHKNNPLSNLLIKINYFGHREL